MPAGPHAELEIVLEQDDAELAMARPRGPAAMSTRVDPRPDADIYTVDNFIATTIFHSAARLADLRCSTNL